MKKALERNGRSCGIRSTRAASPEKGRWTAAFDQNEATAAAVMLGKVDVRDDAQGKDAAERRNAVAPTGRQKRATAGDGSSDETEVAAAATILGEAPEDASTSWVRTAEDAAFLRASGFWDFSL